MSTSFLVDMRQMKSSDVQFQKNKSHYLFQLPFLNFVTEIIDFLLSLEPCGEDIETISLIAVEMHSLVSHQPERNTPTALHSGISVLTAKVSCLVIYCKILVEKSHRDITKWDQEPILEAEKSIVTSDFIIKVTWGLVSRLKEIQTHAQVELRIITSIGRLDISGLYSRSRCITYMAR